MAVYNFEGGPSPIIKVWINGVGEVVEVTNMKDQPLVNKDYHRDESKRIDDGGVLVTENYCRWQLVGGVWRCL
jgi:hypothetical protein